MITNEPEIDQCMVYGDKKNYLVALVVPNKEFLNQQKKIQNIIEKTNNKLTLLEKIKKIQLIDENFSIENGLMTPTMKVKRKKVTEKYKNQLEKLY
jgi:long-chain acyl-CoA synthetase